MTTPVRPDLFIDGASVPASDGRRLEVRSPASGELVGTVAAATAVDVDRAVAAASAAFPKWASLTAYEREATIKRALTHVRARADEIGMLMALEQGKPLAQARGEVQGACDTIDYFASEAVRVEGAVNPTESRSFRSWVVYQPVGVCALITPWNYPVSLLSWKLGPALATGCTMIVKPTSVTPLSPLAFCEALVAGGIPGGVISVLTGSGAVLGDALVRHPGVAKVAMTGSSATGKRIMAAGGPLLKKISLELGGHCPAIVFGDADLDNAASVLTYKKFRNCGQSCSSVNRVYAHRDIHDVLVAKTMALAERLTVGDGASSGAVDLGPMATADGLATVERHVADALRRGACLVCGGRRPGGEAFARGHFYLPTILTGATPAMEVMREETFGPVLPFASFDRFDEAIALANDTAYGLAAFVFTRDLATAHRASEALEAGTVCVNHGAVNTNYGPYAGWKDSGMGMELSRRAVFEYLKPKHIKMQL
ncbi:MAG TPA: NAD-dependent succinate-semialdehyde dehydrogenase [Opitutaceae bacterium]|nr:NAD-dependent succinate-semialdehyde dehydrogenase [Opitutaceae bacterium]